MVPIVLLTLSIGLAIWVGRVVSTPFIKCHRCDGTGKRRYRRGVRACRYCKGHRKILRLSWRIYSHARNGRQTIVRPR